MPEMITKDHVIKQVVDAHPGIDQVFKAHGLPCTGCHVSTYETVAGGARTHNLDVEALLGRPERLRQQRRRARRQDRST